MTIVGVARFPAYPPRHVANADGPSLIITGEAWTTAQFVALFRQGVLPGGAPAPESMPWKELAPALSDMDLQALHAYLGSQ